MDSFNRLIDTTTPRTLLHRQLDVEPSQETPAPLRSQTARGETSAQKSRGGDDEDNLQRLIPRQHSRQVEALGTNVIFNTSEVRGGDQTYANLTAMDSDESSIEENIEVVSTAMLQKRKQTRQAEHLIELGTLTSQLVSKPPKHPHSKKRKLDDPRLESSNKKISVRQNIDDADQTLLGNKTYAHLSPSTIDSSSDSIDIETQRFARLTQKRLTVSLPRIDTKLAKFRGDSPIQERAESTRSDHSSSKVSTLQTADESQDISALSNTTVENLSISRLDKTFDVSLGNEESFEKAQLDTRQKFASSRMAATKQIQLNLTSVLEALQAKDNKDIMHEDSSEVTMEQMHRSTNESLSTDTAGDVGDKSESHRSVRTSRSVVTSKTVSPGSKTKSSKAHDSRTSSTVKAVSPMKKDIFPSPKTRPDIKPAKSDPPSRMTAASPKTTRVSPRLRASSSPHGLKLDDPYSTQKTASPRSAKSSSPKTPRSGTSSPRSAASSSSQTTSRSGIASPALKTSPPRPITASSGHKLASPKRKTLSPGHETASVAHKTTSPGAKTTTTLKTIPPGRKTASPNPKTTSPQRKTASPQRKTASPRRKTASPRHKTASPRHKTTSSGHKTASPRPRMASVGLVTGSPRHGTVSSGLKTPSRYTAASPRSKTASPGSKISSPRSKAASPRYKTPLSSLPQASLRSKTPASVKGTASRPKTTSPRAKLASPRPKTASPRTKALSPRSPRAKLASPRPKTASPRTKALSPRAKTLSPRPKTPPSGTKKASSRLKMASLSPETVSHRSKTASPRTKTDSPRTKLSTASPRKSKSPSPLKLRLSPRSEVEEETRGTPIPPPPSFRDLRNDDEVFRSSFSSDENSAELETDISHALFLLEDGQEGEVGNKVLKSPRSPRKRKHGEISSPSKQSAVERISHEKSASPTEKKLLSSLSDSVLKGNPRKSHITDEGESDMNMIVPVRQSLLDYSRGRTGSLTETLASVSASTADSIPVRNLLSQLSNLSQDEEQERSHPESARREVTTTAEIHRESEEEDELDVGGPEIMKEGEWERMEGEKENEGEEALQMEYLKMAQRSVPVQLEEEEVFQDAVADDDDEGVDVGEEEVMASEDGEILSQEEKEKSVNAGTGRELLDAEYKKAKETGKVVGKSGMDNDDTESEDELNLLPVVVRKSVSYRSRSSQVGSLMNVIMESAHNDNQKAGSHGGLGEADSSRGNEAGTAGSGSSRGEVDSRPRQLTMRKFLLNLTRKPVKTPVADAPAKASLADMVKRMEEVGSSSKFKTPVGPKRKIVKKPKKSMGCLSKSITREAFCHFARCRVTAGAIDEVMKCCEQFWANFSRDLMALSSGKQGREITAEAIAKLFRRQGLAKTQEELNALVEKTLPVEQWQYFMPATYAMGNVFPQNVRQLLPEM